MLVVHTAFRREFRLLPGVVRAVAVGDTGRAATIRDHVTLISNLLHHHHGGEDRLLWPRLLARVTDDLTPTVLLMEAQHERLSAQLDEVERLGVSFAASASAPAQEELAAACEQLHTLLDEHLTAEETRLLPVAARYISAEEWEAMGEEGLGTLPKRQLPLAWGFLSYEGDRDVLAGMLAPAPAPIRLLLPRLGARSYRRYARRVHGTAAP